MSTLSVALSTQAFIHSFWSNRYLNSGLSLCALLRSLVISSCVFVCCVSLRAISDSALYQFSFEVDYISTARKDMVISFSFLPRCVLWLLLFSVFAFSTLI
jgi:hypothetical protein